MSRNAYRYADIEGASENSPLFFTFHGTGGDEHQFTSFARDLVPTARIISPRGDVSEGGALRFFKRKSEGVYDMADLAQRRAAIASFVQDFTKEAPQRKVLGLGYSNGANILASVMFEHPDLFDAAVLMHPHIPFEPREGMIFGQRKVLITAGKHDPICPPPRTVTLEDYFKREDADVQTFWHEGGHEVRPEEIASIKAFLAPFGDK